jgi:uncharacterized protein YjgD (DUF1641 family)
MIDGHNIRDFIISMYILTRILPIELHRCAAFFEDAMAEVKYQILYIEFRSSKNIDAKMSSNMDQALSLSLDKLMQNIEKWSKCKKPSKSSISFDDMYNYMVCIKECYLKTSILRAINEYLEKINTIKSDKSDFEKKIDNLTKVMDYLSSSNILDALYERLEKKIDEELHKSMNRPIINDESEDRQPNYLADLKKSINEIRYIFQIASKDVEENIKYLLKNPEEDIK